MHLLHTLVALTTLAATTRSSAAAVPADFDCGMRKLALQFSQRLQPAITPEQLSDIAVALSGSPESSCKVRPEQQRAVPASAPTKASVLSDAIVVSPDGKDTNPGTAQQPLGTITAAVAKSRSSGAKIIML